ncbi:MAG: hypothetical protein HZC36_08835 [Armatimonadetes bacterium]|nr:hypothetical protein [Armatimonadota bacterium]
MERLTILHTNDLHGALTPENAARIRELKEAHAPCLYFDSGDCIKAGNLAIPLRQERAWALLAQAGCDASTLGNRESHPLESAFQSKLAGARHPIIVSNVRRKDAKGQRDGATGTSPPNHRLTNSSSPHPHISSSHHPFPGTVIFDRAGIRVGVIGVMVPMVTERMKTAFASAYLWDNPIEAVKRELATLICNSKGPAPGRQMDASAPSGVEALKQDTGEDSSHPGRGGGIPMSATRNVFEKGSPPDLFIALTHIGITQDRRLAEACPELDLILGGHSHTVLEQPERIGTTWICQGGSHGRYVGRYVWDSESGLAEAELLAL